MMPIVTGPVNLKAIYDGNWIIICTLAKLFTSIKLNTMTHAILLFVSGQDLIIIAILALLLFGGKKIPEFAKGLGEGIRQFKDASEGKSDDHNNAPKDPEKK